MHAHTCHSHGKASVEDMYCAAKARGLSIFGFSEHSPRPPGYAYPTDYQEKLVGSFARYVVEVREMAKRGAAEGLTVLLGLEVDYIPGHEDCAKDLCSSYNFDYIIGGLHFQDNWGFDYTADDWTGLTEKKRFAVYHRYYDDLAAMCAAGLFNIAAHPDLIKLFSADSFARWLNSQDGFAQVRRALTVMKDNGVILEVSSAGLRKPCKEIYPGPKIMKLAAGLGLSISFASDAHCTATPAYAFDKLAAYAASFGYRHSCAVCNGQVLNVPFETS